MSPEEQEGNEALESLIARYLEAEKSGQALDREALIEEHPEVADSLRDFFANHDRMKAAASLEEPTLPPNGGGLDDPTIPPGQGSHEDATIPPQFAGDDPTIPPTEGVSKPAEPTVGDQVRYFGDYELLEEIARGGMGVVFKARQINLNRIVALKMILSGEFAGEEDIKRFHAEAEAAAQLDHPGIVPIFEIGEHQGQHYFSKGFVEGESLAQKVADGPLPPHKAAELVKKLCDAMSYAHERGVIHRDLKPANILIDQNGQPKVTDFGLAKKTQADSNLTGTGQILGTPAYMPPEQASGKTDVGPLADVYSLGAILYCLLTGRPPFQAASPMDTLLQFIDKDPISPRQLDPTVPIDIDTIGLKCLSKDPKKRYTSAYELSDELGRFLNGQPILARPVGRVERSWRWCKRQPVIAGLALAFAIAMIAGTTFSTYFAIESLKSEVAANVSFARSNYLLASARWDAGRVSDAINVLGRIPGEHRNIEWHLDRRRFDGGYMTLGGHTAPAISVVFSPDNQLIASGDWEGNVKIWDAATGQESLSLPGDGSPVSCLAFSRDSRQLCSTGNQGKLCIWAIDSGNEVHPLKPISRNLRAATFSPDGTHVAYGGADGTIDVCNLLQRGASRDYSKMHQRSITCLAFSPSMKLLALGTDKGELYLRDLHQQRKERSFQQTQPITCVSFSPDGSRVVLAEELRTIRVIDAKNGSEIALLKGHQDQIDCVAFSPDGAQVVSAGWDGTIRLWNAAMGEMLQTLRGHTGPVRDVAFSPDGGRIASSGQSGDIKVWDTRS